MPGLFVAVEGPEGAGKTTLAGCLARRLREAGYEVLEVREPGGTEVAEAARGVVLDPAMDCAPAAELFLMLAARADLVAKVIRPWLARRRGVVLSDRYDLSTEAYQIAGRGLPREAVLAANQLATEGLVPDLTLVLDIPPEVGRRRHQADDKAPDRLEQADPAMHERVRQAFREAAGPGVVHLDATRPLPEVERAAWEVLRGWLDGTP